MSSRIKILMIRITNKQKIMYEMMREYDSVQLRWLAWLILNWVLRTIFFVI